MNVTVGLAVNVMLMVMFDPATVTIPDEGEAIHPFDSANAV